MKCPGTRASARTGTPPMARTAHAKVFHSVQVLNKLGRLYRYVIDNNLKRLNNFKDIDECETDQHQCAYRCKNESPENGKYSCGCPPGYKLRRDGRHCEDEDECAQ